MTINYQRRIRCRRKAFKVKSINPWNNENDKSTGKITAISGANLSSTDLSGANYMPDVVDKTGTVQGTDGRTLTLGQDIWILTRIADIKFNYLKYR